MSEHPSHPNVVLILADNLGWGELVCYGGGAFRGAPTLRIDAFAQEGLLQHSFNVENNCVPTHSALMTGRRPFRTGCQQSVPPGFPPRLTPCEKTLAEVLKDNGCASAHHGKWHLGDIQGRYPSDRGFDEWYGIPRTTDETQFPTAVGFAYDAAEFGYVMKGTAGTASENGCTYDLSLYHPMVHLHFPTLPHPNFAGKSGHGDFADSTMEMDYRVGQLLDHIDSLGVRDNTIVIFASDNRPQFRGPYRGTAGPWSGTYHTAMEGSLRVLFIIRWPGKVPKNVTSNEIVHVNDIFTTIISLTGSTVPSDRPIDGVDQT
ncbi:alkaline phosphatase-like protein [Thozetella sp. PMI_491]|nr:alkaline phosphatase-like protein [Thozetella sp. PMI_491]